jgi:LysM repeat protein
MQASGTVAIGQPRCRSALSPCGILSPAVPVETPLMVRRARLAPLSGVILYDLILKRWGSAMFRLGIYRTALIVGCCLVAACAERRPAVVPAAPPAAAKPIYVVVARGQSLDRIAQTYHVAKDDIIAANQLKPPYRLKPGTVLAIPVVATEASEPAITRPKTDIPPRSVAKPDKKLRAAVKPDRNTPTSTPGQHTKSEGSEQAVFPPDNPTPAQASTKKLLPSHQEVIPLDDPVPGQRATSNSSTSPVADSPDAAGPRILFPGPAPDTDERPSKP